MLGRLVKTVLIYLLVFFIVILIVLFPRHMTITVDQNLKYTSDASLNFEQYKSNIVGFFNGVMENKSLGITRYDLTVEEEIARFLPRSLEVVVAALLISTVLGIAKGFFDYKSTKRKRGFFGNGTTWLLQSVPDFLVILLVQWLVIRYFSFIDFFGREGWNAFILPSFLVSIYPTMYIARITSAALASQDGKLYIQVAKAKGLTNRMVLYKHIFMNSISTILTHLPSLMLYILSNLLLVEYFMDYKGLGQRLFEAIDYNISFGTGASYEPGLIIGISFCFMCLILIVELISQIVSRDKRENAQ